MSKVRTVSRFALFFLVMAVASTAVAAEKATPSGKVVDRKLLRLLLALE